MAILATLALAIGLVGIVAGGLALLDRPVDGGAEFDLDSEWLDDDLGDGQSEGGRPQQSDRGHTRESQRRARPGAANDPLGELVEDGRGTIREIGGLFAGLMPLTAAEQREVGRQVSEGLLREMPRLDDRRQFERVRALLLPVLAVERLPDDIPTQLILLDTDVVNAFAHVGGYVYVCRGLLELVHNDDELQFVLAHEVGHLVRRHGLEKLTLSKRASELTDDLGSVVLAAHHALALGYSEEQEFEADAHATFVLCRLGKGREPGIRCLQRLASHFDEAPPRPVPADPAERLAWEVESHFRTHPPTEHRVEAIRQWEPSSADRHGRR